MKRTGLLIGLCICCLMLSSCSNWNLGKETVTRLPRCETVTPPNKGAPAVSQVYKGTLAGACVAYLSPFDQAGWWESRLNSHRLRAESVLRLGCTHCPVKERDCKSVNDCGGCNTAQLYFDFTQIQEDAEVSKAMLAVYVTDNLDNMYKAVLEGRVNVGGDFVIVAGKPEIKGNWVLFDITRFACRAIVERRNSVTLDLSLPCGTDNRTKLATVALSAQHEPTVIIEYR